ncbi:hypothetical protein Zmor_025395 [Zophobas morio]|uniref:Uncharacterized protein n=1 Tax=Zophobas morio TaxID=2755281 RepID=A0AA38HTI3_9CUCU|nr:hypothetical protein Zmor_025395 [Zophobas morio]
MRESLELFERTLEESTSCQNLQNNLMDLVENLYKDLECERLSTTNLQKQIQYFVDQDVFGITSKFAELKDECDLLNNKLTLARNENDDLNIQLIAKTQETKKFLTEKENELKTQYEIKLRQKDEEITKKEQEVAVVRGHSKLKQQELFTELQVSQTSAATELDKKESEFRRQLNESNKKLKDSMDTCNILRIELIAVKEQFAEYKKASNEKIAELQKRIKEMSGGGEVPVSSDVLWTNDLDVSTSSDKSNKYKPLNVSCRNIFALEDKPINLKKVPVYRSSGKSGNIVPPLVRLRDNSKESNLVTNNNNKKRKLYNPDDLSYLSVNVDENM